MDRLNVFDVAKSILESFEDGTSAIKLQKLFYYCQAWHLVWTGNPLFDNNFQAWRYGPVCRELYDVHKGSFSLKASDIPDQKLTRALTQEEVDTINKVVSYYGDKPAGWLVELSHNELPWKSIREKCRCKPDGNCEEVIPNDLIRKYYASL